MEKQIPKTARADQRAFMPVLAAAIRRRRKELGWTQEDLAKAAGCGLAYLYLLENGKTTLRLDKLLDVMFSLGLQFTLEKGEAGIEVRDVPSKSVVTQTVMSVPAVTPFRPVAKSPVFDFID